MEAEGIKESQILTAQGQSEARIIQAEGEAQAKLKVAQAEAKAIEMIKNVVPDGNPTPYLIAMQYIKTLSELAKDKDNKLVIVPYEASALMGSLSVVKSLFEQNK